MQMREKSNKKKITCRLCIFSSRELGTNEPEQNVFISEPLIYKLTLSSNLKT